LADVVDNNAISALYFVHHFKYPPREQFYAGLIERSFWFHVDCVRDTLEA
jgi:hypothetical protein